MCGHCDISGHDYCGDRRDERISVLTKQVQELSLLVLELKTKSGGCGCGGACKPKQQLKKTTKRRSK